MKTLIYSLFMFLWLHLSCVSRGEKVEQSPTTLSVQEGDSAVINCTYSDSAAVYFPWYKQEAGKGLQHIIDIRSNKEMNQIQRFIVVLNKRAKHFFLNITTTQAGDSAVYFCAASARCFPDTCSLY
ncbi:T-cell receptor alpha chain V region CTL-L17 [Sciurus carolinensis]|nr:T-cell receptor alpha chain V region CTL-L17 [Sciurus carolinensis]